MKESVKGKCSRKILKESIKGKYCINRRIIPCICDCYIEN